ncbi:MAG TPA: glycoside hydrolase family 3 protein, partial [Rhodothermales bacterium]|nr:glycoside hydrolase family 3 protein [Rhodothermales bacterium]
VAFLREYGIRGVVLFQRNLTSENQVRGLTESLRAAVGRHVLVGIDQEGGGVWRTRTLPFGPSAMSLGASDDPQLAERVGHAVGRGLHALGLNWNYAPVLDVNNNPRNPVIGDRSFGSDPALVERLGMAWLRGLTRAGVAGCVKHFPGHGDTAVDSHLGLPVVDKPMEVLERLELAPFRAAAAANVPAFMTAHIVFPALDREHPATLSRAILTGLLRERYGYDGVITTDAMGMQAITDRYGRGDAATLALTAGADLVMALGSTEDKVRTAEAIAGLLRGNQIPASELRRKTARLDALAARFPVQAGAYEGPAREEDVQTMRTAWARGLTTFRDPRPLPDGSAFTLIVPAAAAGGAASDAGMSGTSLTVRLSPHYDLRVHTFDPARDPRETLPEFERIHRPGTPVVFASTGRVRMDEGRRAFAAAVRPSLHLALWNPYSVLDVVGADGQPVPALVTFGFRPEALDAAVAWLRGQVPATGRWPVSLDAA